MHSDYATARKIAILILTPIPWSARVPLDPLFAIEVSFIHAVQADGGVGCGPGGPPHNQCRLCGCWEKYVALGFSACGPASSGSSRPEGRLAGRIARPPIYAEC